MKEHSIIKLRELLARLNEAGEDMPGAIGVVKRLKKKGVTKTTKSFKAQVKQKQKQQTQPNKPQANQQRAANQQQPRTTYTGNR